MLMFGNGVLIGINSMIVIDFVVELVAVFPVTLVVERILVGVSPAWTNVLTIVKDEKSARIYVAVPSRIEYPYVSILYSDGTNVRFRSMLEILVAVTVS